MRHGHCPHGCYWNIYFYGEQIEITIEENDLSTLTTDPAVTTTSVITVIQEMSKNYRYVPISSDLLFTLETAPTV